MGTKRIPGSKDGYSKEVAITLALEPSEKNASGRCSSFSSQNIPNHSADAWHYQVIDNGNLDRNGNKELSHFSEISGEQELDDRLYEQQHGIDNKDENHGHRIFRKL